MLQINAVSIPEKNSQLFMTLIIIRN